MRLMKKNDRRSCRTLVAIIFGFMLLTGCAYSTNVQQIDRLEAVNADPRIILMPPDIRYYLISAGGIPEPHAEWTTAAKNNFVDATQQFADSIGTNLKVISETNLSQTEIAYEELHSAVGSTVIINHFGASKLPAKKDVFDWSLGPGVSSIAKDHDADYALFVHYRDRQASGGRVAMGILAAALGGAADFGSESGFASLVDLRTGDIVWFNVVNAGSGELRDESGAASAVTALFKDMPTNPEG